MLRDIVAGVVAVLLMYVPLGFRDVHGWTLYLYWVLVAAAYTGYAIARLRRGV